MRAVRKKSLILMPLAGVIIFICFYAKIENFFVFHPQKNHDMLPDQLGLAYESIFFEASDGTKLHGWFFPLPRKSPIILFCHGNRDEIIPFNMGENLFEAAPEPKAFYAIEGAGHNDTWLIGGSRYFETFKRFIQS